MNPSFISPEIASVSKSVYYAKKLQWTNEKWNGIPKCQIRMNVNMLIYRFKGYYNIEIASSRFNPLCTQWHNPIFHLRLF